VIILTRCFSAVAQLLVTVMLFGIRCLRDNSLQSPDKDQLESRAVVEKPHDAVVKFDTIGLQCLWFLPRDASAERGYEIACRLSVCNVQVP